jgi:hypothetical protein
MTAVGQGQRRGASTSDDAAQTVSIDGSWDAVQDYYYDHRWTDGLPIVPPTRERVRAMLRFTDRPPEAVVGRLRPRKGAATVERIAINAVMAGCKPEYLPVLITAVEAVADPAFNLNAMQSTTHPNAVAMMLNGPIGRELQVNSGTGCMGPGRRANATLGRALSLLLLNVGGGLPGDGDLATHGTPAKYSYCFAENEEANPWQPLHVEKGFASEDSVVTVLAAEGPHNVLDNASISGLSLLSTIAGAMRQSGGNNIRTFAGQPMVVISPEHADQMVKDGYTKESIKRYLWENARLYMKDVSAEWRESERYLLIAAEVGQSDWVSVARHWTDIDIVVAGGPGKHSCWLPTRGGGSATVSRRIERNR